MAANSSSSGSPPSPVALVVPDAVVAPDAVRSQDPLFRNVIDLLLTIRANTNDAAALIDENQGLLDSAKGTLGGTSQGQFAHERCGSGGGGTSSDRDMAQFALEL
ncbi:hypothetical protein OROHE_003227 [Orobanche hederae]